MTTIAYREGVVASDSRALAGYQILQRPAQKLFPSQKHNLVFAIAGELAAGASFVRILESLPKMPWISGKHVIFEQKAAEDVTIVAFQHDRRVFEFEAGHWFETTADILAFGSGSSAALAAMACGADAPKAVTVSSTIDAGTDDRVVFYKLADFAPKKRAAARRR